jgi:16S rRNA (guanine527-N7)-methyltransferase
MIPGGLPEGLSLLGLSLSEAGLQTTATYAALLQKWNKTYNLTAVRDPQGILALHLFDSLAVLPYLTPGARNLIDIGSGAGLPGIPLAIARPDLSITLLDSNSKKSAFQRQAVIELGLRNVSVINARVEQFKPDKGYDLIISRAFSELADFVSASSHLLAPVGMWLAMKGLYPEKEIAALPLGVDVRGVFPLSVPGVEAERHLIALQITDPTTERTQGA